MPEGKGWVSHHLPHGGTLSQSGKLRGLEEEISESYFIKHFIVLQEGGWALYRPPMVPSTLNLDPPQIKKKTKSGRHHVDP